MMHTVLIVEDEPELRDTLRELLELEGFNAVGARDGREALSLLPAIEHVCLVILDLLMPGMNGWDFFAALRSSSYAATPVIIATSVPSRAPAGANAVLAKPLDFGKIMATVQSYCAA